MEDRPVYCLNCAYKNFLRKAFISSFISLIVIVLISVITLINTVRRDSHLGVQSSFIIDDLNNMAFSMYHSLNHNEPGIQHTINNDRIKTALQHILAADKAGYADYALENSGGKIISIGDTQPFWPIQTNIFRQIIHYMGFDDLTEIKNGPRRVIQSSMEPGECFAFVGEKGEILIGLVRKIHITAVSVDHILAQMSPDASITNAPKQFSVYGVHSDMSDVYLGTFSYDIESGQPTQTFIIERESVRKFKMIRFRFTHNHGSSSNTCVYRVRVHGLIYAPVLE